jgi:hypothetical protein
LKNQAIAKKIVSMKGRHSRADYIKMATDHEAMMELRSRYPKGQSTDPMLRRHVSRELLAHANNLETLNSEASKRQLINDASLGSLKSFATRSFLPSPMPGLSSGRFLDLVASSKSPLISPRDNPYQSPSVAYDPERNLSSMKQPDRELSTPSTNILAETHGI